MNRSLKSAPRLPAVALIIAAAAISISEPTMAQSGSIWMKPLALRMNDMNDLSVQGPPLAAVIFGSVGAVSRVVVTIDRGTAIAIMRGQEVRPGARCWVLFDGIPPPGKIVRFPHHVEGNHCAPMNQSAYIVTWGSGTASAGEVHLCTYYIDYNYSAPPRFGEKGPPTQPCCQIMPAPCKAEERFSGDIDRNNWQGLRNQFGDPIPFAGQWNTNFGRLQIDVSGARASGNFGTSGRLTGTLSHTLLTGEWDSGKARGTLRLVVAAKGDSFSGTWMNAQGEKGEWNGSYIGGNSGPGCTSGTYAVRAKSTTCPGGGGTTQDTVDLQVTFNGGQITITNPNMRSGPSSSSGTIRADGTFAVTVPASDGRTYTITGRCSNGVLEVTIPFGDCSLTFEGSRRQ